MQTNNRSNSSNNTSDNTTNNDNNNKHTTRRGLAFSARARPSGSSPGRTYLSIYI